MVEAGKTEREQNILKADVMEAGKTMEVAKLKDGGKTLHYRERERAGALVSRRFRSCAFPFAPGCRKPFIMQSCTAPTVAGPDWSEIESSSREMSMRSLGSLLGKACGHGNWFVRMVCTHRDQ